MFRVSHYSRLLLLVTVAVISTVFVPPALAQSQEDIDEADAAHEAAHIRLVDISNQVAAAGAAYDDIRSQIFTIEYQIERLRSRINRDETEANVLRETARRILISAYVNRSPDAVEVALQVSNIQDLVIRKTLADRATQINTRALSRLQAVSRELDRLSGKLDEDRGTLDGLRLEAQDAAEHVTFLLGRSQDELDRTDAATKEARKRYLAHLRAEEERKRREAENKKSTGGSRRIGGLICPQGGAQYFRNDWGNPRSGGRTHKGNDIFGARGEKLFAVIGGTLRTRTGGLGGIALWLFGNDGHAYYYAHLDRWANGISTGTRVSQGDVIGYVGNSGNASGGATHTHFEIHPNYGAAVNPYWTLIQVCG